MARIVRVLEYYGDQDTIMDLVSNGIVPSVGGKKLRFSNGKEIVVYSHLLHQTGNGYAKPSEGQRNTPSNSQKIKRGRKNAKRKGSTD